jgi:RNA polymerase sigma factor (sigma-70 family)
MGDELTAYRRYRLYQDREAFEELHRRLREVMYAEAWRTCRQAQRAEDVVQAAWERLLTTDRWHHIQENRHFRNWVLLIVRRLACRPPHGVAPARGDLPDVADPARTAEDLAEERERLEQLRCCLDELPPVLRSVLDRRYLADARQTLEEIAEQDGVAASTVHRRERRAIEALAECLLGQSE